MTRSTDMRDRKGAPTLRGLEKLQTYLKEKGFDLPVVETLVRETSPTLYHGQEGAGKSIGSPVIGVRPLCLREEISRRGAWHEVDDVRLRDDSGNSITLTQSWPHGYVAIEAGSAALDEFVEGRRDELHDISRDGTRFPTPLHWIGHSLARLAQRFAEPNPVTA